MGFPVCVMFFNIKKLFKKIEMYRRKITRKHSSIGTVRKALYSHLVWTPAQPFHCPFPVTQRELTQGTDRAEPGPSAQEISAI